MSAQSRREHTMTGGYNSPKHMPGEAMDPNLVPSSRETARIANARKTPGVVESNPLSRVEKFKQRFEGRMIPGTGNVPPS